MRLRNKILSTLPVIAATLNVIEKSGVGRSRRRLFMYSVSGATEDARSLSRNALACCVRGTRVSAWMTRNASNRAGGKSNPRFASGGNSCARRKPLSKSRRKRSIEAFAGSTICNSSNDERTRSSAGTKCISSNTSRDTATPSSSIESVCMYSFTNQGSGWNKRARMGGDEFALDSSAGRSISITIPPNSFPVPVKNRSTYIVGVRWLTRRASASNAADDDKLKVAISSPSRA
mmetsp:Transcript_600/g.2474  ORF Transcript_600/g.2474 Transcript_600/m.2474 type:complete len:233 (-) Transcript_600:803-1501(-)